MTQAFAFAFKLAARLAPQLFRCSRPWDSCSSCCSAFGFSREAPVRCSLEPTGKTKAEGRNMISQGLQSFQENRGRWFRMPKRAHPVTCQHNFQPGPVEADRTPYAEHDPKEMHGSFLHRYGLVPPNRHALANMRNMGLLFCSPQVRICTFYAACCWPLRVGNTLKTSWWTQIPMRATDNIAVFEGDFWAPPKLRAKTNPCPLGEQIILSVGQLSDAH